MPKTLTSSRSAADLDELAALGLRDHFKRNQIILNEGEESDGLIVILKGRVRVFSTSTDGRQVFIDEHGAGEYVGEMALDGSPRSASVIALTDCDVSIVAKDMVLEHIRTHPDFALALIHKLAHRARLATENFKGLALLNVYGRLSRLLTSMAEPENGKLTIATAPTHAEIAQRVGASREMVSIIMRDLSAGGYIEKNGRQLTIAKALPQRW
jgi:CRP/FNR family transcriptional regulator, cyclic AMP receptor protein